MENLRFSHYWVTMRTSCYYYLDFVLPSCSCKSVYYCSICSKALNKRKLYNGFMQKYRVLFKSSVNIILSLPLLTKGQGSTEAGEASCPSVSNVLCHKGPPLGRGSLPWSTSPTWAHQRTTASREQRLHMSTSTLTWCEWSGIVKHNVYHYHSYNTTTRLWIKILVIP